MRYYVKVLCLTAAAAVLVAFIVLIVVLAASVLSSAVQGDWMRAVAHTICLLVAGMMLNLLVNYIDDNIC